MQTSGAPLVPYHANSSGEMVPGTGNKKPIKPYVRFDLKELRGVPSHSTGVWVLLLRQWHATKKDWVTIPKRVRQEAGIPRRQIARGLQTLEDEGFVELKKGKGRSTQVCRCK
jgi:hypothetical protein